MSNYSQATPSVFLCFLIFFKKLHTCLQTHVHVHMQNAVSYVTRCSAPVRPFIGARIKVVVEKRKEAEWEQWSEDKIISYEGGDQKERVNYYRGPGFLWVRHVTEETDSGKTAAVVRK